MSETRDERGADEQGRLQQILRGHVSCGDRYCSTFDGGNERCGDCSRAVARAAVAVERIVAERVSQALEAEADLIGNGTCCPECDAVADAMRDRALLPLNRPRRTDA